MFSFSFVAVNIDPTTSSMGNTNTFCNITACRLIIVGQIQNNSLYNTTDFSECNGCSSAAYPNFPEQFFHRWNIENFVIMSSYGQDCRGTPHTGNLTTCQLFCLSDPTCVGFSRKKNVADNDSNSQCYLKHNIQQNQSPNNAIWHTFAFNETL